MSRSRGITLLCLCHARCVTHDAMMPCTMPCRLYDEQLVEQLGLAFNRRAQELINTALNAGAKADLSPVMQKLTLPEKRLLEAGRESTTNFEKWRSRKARMESSQLVKRTKADTNTQRSSRQRR